MVEATHVYAVSAGLLAILVFLVANTRNRHRLLPPGPPLLPILGNLTIFPRKFPHLQFTEWAKQYGDVFSLKVLGQTMIVLNTPTAVRDAFEKHGTACSNRPSSVIADIITPNDMNVGTGHYAGETWKVLRKAASHLLNNQNMRRHQEYQYAEAAQFLWNVSHDPDDWYRHIQRFTTSYFLGIIYGKRAPQLSSADVADFMYVQPKFMHALELGTMPPVDLIPILKYVPERWAAWKTEAKEIRDLHESLYERLVSQVEERRKTGLTLDVFMEKAIENAEAWGLNTREHLTNLGGTLLEGSDTSSASIQYIVLMLLSYPEIQQKLHDELDRVVGNQRAPKWDDIDNMPYMNAFIEEVMRFRPVANLGLPHEMVHDEIINGQLYPKGSILFMNLWMIFHDERYFDKPYEFMPERFLDNPYGTKPGVMDDPARRDNLLFGGGRRVCPGIQFARTSMQLFTMNLAWAFNLTPHVDKATGKPIMPGFDNIAPGITATPLPFACKISPRSKNHADLIDGLFHSVAEHMRPYEYGLSAEDIAFNKKYRDHI